MPLRRHVPHRFIDNIGTVDRLDGLPLGHAGFVVQSQNVIADLNVGVSHPTAFAGVNLGLIVHTPVVHAAGALEHTGVGVHAERDPLDGLGATFVHVRVEGFRECEQVRNLGHRPPLDPRHLRDERRERLGRCAVLDCGHHVRLQLFGEIQYVAVFVEQLHVRGDQQHTATRGEFRVDLRADVFRHLHQLPQHRDQCPHRRVSVREILR